LAACGVVRLFDAVSLISALTIAIENKQKHVKGKRENK
jgi:hypothetical protein